jgi:tRNA (adenine37-N6)-methyltransferase
LSTFQRIAIFTAITIIPQPIIIASTNDIISGTDSLTGKARGMTERHSLELKPIGIIHSPYKNTRDVPRHGHESEDISQVELFQEFEEGLQDIEEFSHIVVIFWFHKYQGYQLVVKTPWDDSPHGLFTTRSPQRPSPLGLTVVELVAREKNMLTVKGLDAVDGTPLLDIKPYIPAIDERRPVKLGWLEGKLPKKRG